MSSYINAILRNVLAEQERLLARYELQSTPYDTTSLITTYPETYHSDYNPETSEKTDFLENTVLRNVLAEQDQLLAEYELQSTPYDTTSLTTTYPEASIPDTSDNIAGESMFDIPNNPFTEASIPDTSDNTTGELVFDIPSNPFTEATMTATLNNHQNQFIQIEKQVADMPSQQGLQNILNQTGEITSEMTSLPIQSHTVNTK